MRDTIPWVGLVWSSKFNDQHAGLVGATMHGFPGSALEKSPPNSEKTITE